MSLNSSKTNNSLYLRKKFDTNKDCKCKLQMFSRIVNGQVAERNLVPWQVSLAEKNSHFCGGLIVNNYWVLTAAHCLVDSKVSDIQIRVGINNLNDKKVSSRTYNAYKLHIHPQYNDKKDASSPGDVGLIQLRKPINFIDGQIEPACLGLNNKRLFPNLMASGWGSIVPTTVGRKVTPAKISNVLKKAYFTSKANCETNQLICIKSIYKGDSICDGDSGGPLHFTNKKLTSVVGVCSFGNGKLISKDTVQYCTGEGAYTRLSSYKNFLINKLGSNNYCKG